MNTETSRPVEILLVEDNPGDVRLTREALKDSVIVSNLNVTVDGEDALRFLRKQGGYLNAVRPDIILLDLNLPKKSGRQVLQEVKQEPNLRNIPVVVLTNSRSQQDVIGAYDLHANCYIHKPVDLLQFWEVVRSIERFWLKLVRLPSFSFEQKPFETKQ